MISSPGLAAETACLKDPGPLSPVLVTVTVAARAGLATASDAANTMSDSITKAFVYLLGVALRIRLMDLSFSLCIEWLDEAGSLWATCRRPLAEAEPTTWVSGAP